MGHNFKETAHLNTNLKSYGENYDRIFLKKEVVPKVRKTISLPTILFLVAYVPYVVLVVWLSSMLGLFEVESILWK